jgi:hypothetical protein
MIFTMDDAYTFCRKVVDSGDCSTTAVYAKINEAVRRLIPTVNTSRMLATIRMGVRNSEFALPREAEKVLAHDANGVPGTVFGRPYQFLHNGPGDFAYNRLGDRSTHQLVSLGEHPYMYPIPPLDNGLTGDLEELYPLGFKLYAFSTEAADSGVEITIRGFGLLAEQLRDGTNVGITFKINRFDSGVEGTIKGSWGSLYNSGDQRFRDIEQVHKPVTAGYVTIYAVYPEENRMWLVGKYHPDETLPVFTRYRITSKSYSSLTPSCTNLLMLVKMRYVPLTRAADVIPLDSLDAIKNMVMAIGYEDARDLQNAVLFEQNAIRLLNNEAGQKDTTVSPPMVLDVTRELSGRYCRSRQGFQ